MSPQSKGGLMNVLYIVNCEDLGRILRTLRRSPVV